MKALTAEGTERNCNAEGRRGAADAAAWEWTVVKNDWGEQPNGMLRPERPFPLITRSLSNRARRSRPPQSSALQFVSVPPLRLRLFKNPNGRGTGPNQARSRLLSTSHVRSASLLVNTHRNASEQASLRRGCSDFDQHASCSRWYVLEVVRLAHTDDLTCEAW